jgi:hypothetical protein
MLCANCAMTSLSKGVHQPDAAQQHQAEESHHDCGSAADVLSEFLPTASGELIVMR